MTNFDIKDQCGNNRFRGLIMDRGWDRIKEEVVSTLWPKLNSIGKQVRSNVGNEIFHEIIIDEAQETIERSL